MIARKQYDYRKLRGRIKEICGTQVAFAKKVGRSNPYISNVLNGQAYFSQNDIEVSSKVLGITSEEIGTYFFTQKVHINET